MTAVRHDLDGAALELIAEAIEYPTPGSDKAATAAASLLTSAAPETALAFAELGEWLRATPLWEQEELYTRLFDLKPSCTLHIGYHVYGEAYQRGALLAGLVAELRGVGLSAEHELPDHLALMLRMWARIPHDADAELLHDRILAPGISVIAKELRRINTPWAAAVASIAHLFPLTADAEREITDAQRNWEALRA